MVVTDFTLNKIHMELSSSILQLAHFNYSTRRILISRLINQIFFTTLTCS